MAEDSPRISSTGREGALTDIERFEAGAAHFRETRELGKRGVYIVMHPYTREHMDVVDFDIEIDRRKAASIPPYEFWSAPLPEVDK